MSRDLVLSNVRELCIFVINVAYRHVGIKRMN